MNTKTRQAVHQKCDGRCAYCGEPLPYKEMQVDHIHPKHLGGIDAIENYHPSCRQCNFYKATFIVNSFRQRLDSITERIKKPFIVRLAMKYGIISFKPFSGKFYFEKDKD